MRIPFRHIPSGGGAVGGDVVDCRLAEVSLEVRAEGASHRWEAPVWFCDPWRPAFGLLGFTGFFDQFVVTVCSYEEWLELRPMGAVTGTR